VAGDREARRGEGGDAGGQGAVPSEVVPSKNSTVPVGCPLPGARVTVAVKVTDWPKTDGPGAGDRGRRGPLVHGLGKSRRGAGREVGVAVVDGGDRMVADREPCSRGEVATPEASRVPVPSEVVPSKKETVPVGCRSRALGVTVR